MSFGSKPQVVENDPYKSMPPEIREYLISSVEKLGESDIRADELRQIYSDPAMLIPDYNGQEGLGYVTGAAEAGMSAAGEAIDSARDASRRATETITGAASTGRATVTACSLTRTG